jgi:hypothetical protein
MATQDVPRAGTTRQSRAEAAHHGDRDRELRFQSQLRISRGRRRIPLSAAIRNAPCRRPRSRALFRIRGRHQLVGYVLLAGILFGTRSGRDIRRSGHRCGGLQIVGLLRSWVLFRISWRVR